MCGCQRIPEHFQLNCRNRQIILPQQIDNFAVRVNRTILASSAYVLEYAAHLGVEASAIRVAIHHEHGQGGARIHQEQIADGLQRVDIEMAPTKLPHNGVAMLWGADDEYRLTGHETGAQKVCRETSQGTSVLVKPNGVNVS